MEQDSPENPSNSPVSTNPTSEIEKSNEQEIKDPLQTTVSLDLSLETRQDSTETASATIDISSTKTKVQIGDTESDLPTEKYDPKNVHYEGDIAIYTDPKSGYQYKWDTETNEWLPKGGVTYGYENDTHTYTDADGVKYFWDVQKNAWFPKIDDDFMARYQMSYGFVDNKTEEKESEEKEEVTEEVKKVEPKKEKVASVKRKVDVTPPTWFEVNDQQNTKKYGLVMRDLQTGKMKVKLYTVPETDILKGDALCTYIKVSS
ncbi:barricade [Carabus blaptoides fortunei]